MQYDAFFSYSRKDQTFADALCHQLEQIGVRCWIDHRDLPVGFSWAGEISRILNANPDMVMILIFSSATNESGQVIKELCLADNHKLGIIPVRIEDVSPKVDYEYHLMHRHWLDAFANQQEQLTSISEKIKATIQLHIHRKSPDKTDICGESQGSPNATFLPSKTTSVSQTVDMKEADQKYANAVKIALVDGNISSSERDKLNCLAMDLSISPERMKELESTMLPETMNSDEQRRTSISREKERVSSPEVDMSWPAIGGHFLNIVKNTLDLSSLPFSPVEITEDNDLAIDLELKWHVDPKHFFSVWLYDKRHPNVKVCWGYHSINERNDPVFRRTCKAIRELDDLADDDGDVVINGKIYDLVTDGRLGFELNEEVKVALTELVNQDLVKSVTQDVIALANNIWPAIEANTGEK